MILVDANLLLYAHVSDYAQHAAARDWLDNKLGGTARVGLPWPSLLAFLRIVTSPRIYKQPDSMDAAWRQVNAWLSQDTAWIPQPTERHQDILGRLLASSSVHGNLVQDTHLAALAIEHGLTLCSADGDFARFPNLRWANPLAPPTK